MDQDCLPVASPMCAEPTFMFPDGHQVLCVRQSDGTSTYLDRAQADVLLKLAEMRPSQHHVLKLCRDDLESRIQALTEWRIVPSWLANIIISAFDKASLNSGPEIFGKLFERRCRDLVTLHEKGLIVSAEHVIANSRCEPSQKDAKARIGYVSIPTCARPEHLKRCLATFTDNFESHGRNDIRILVVDDSKDATIQRLNRELIDNSNSRHAQGPRVEHFGTKERQKLTDSLCRRVKIPKEVIEFAFNPNTVLSTHGASRNTLTALTLDSQVLETDDDTLCAYGLSESQPRELVVSASEEPCQTWFYQNHEMNLRSHRLDRYLDPLSAHEQYLGQSVSSIFGRYSNIAWEGVTPDLLTSVRAGGGYVGLTATGCLGDCGLGSSIRFLAFMPAEILDELCANAENWNAAMYGREVFRVATRATIGRGTYFQPMSHAMDNTYLVPPYFPMGRNEGQVFAVLYLRSNSRLWLCHLPLTIQHLSEPGRTYSFGYESAFCRIGVANIVKLCIESASISTPADCSTSFRSFGNQLMEVAALPHNSFLSYLHAQLARSRTASINMLEKKIADNRGRKRLWTEALVKVVAKTRESLTDETCIVPFDLARAVGPLGALQMVQNYLGLFGRLLVYWEEILFEARKLPTSNASFAHSLF